MNENFIFRLMGFIVTLGVIYLICAFIAWDANPLNWWLFKTSAGRLIAAVILIFTIAANFIEDFGKVK